MALPAQPNRSLLEGLEVLLGLAQQQGPVGVRTLARQLGLSPTRVQRYLATLAHVGLTSRTVRGQYALGPGIHALSAMSLAASGLTTRALRVLPGFDDLGVVVALGVLWRETVNYLYLRTPGMQAIEAIGRPVEYPARQSSIGMLLLARKDQAYLDRFFPGQQAELAGPLNQIRQSGQAIVHQPNGEISLAVPVGNPPLAALALSGSFPEAAIPDLLQRLRPAAALLGQTTNEND